MLFESFIHYNIDEYESHLLYGLRKLQWFQLTFIKNHIVCIISKFCCVFIPSKITTSITLQKCKFIIFWMSANSVVKNRMVCRIHIPCYLPDSMLRYKMYGQDTVDYTEHQYQTPSTEFPLIESFSYLKCWHFLYLCCTHTNTRTHIHA